MELSTLQRCCLVLALVSPCLMEVSRAYQNSECATSMRINKICYQCAHRQLEISEFSNVFNQCCLNNQEIREYCESVYTEPPRRGGLWIE